MERSFAEEVKQLALGEGQVLRGEGILAITKALLQAGVSYVGGYPGAPVSHLLDVLADANESLLKPMGVYLDASANEAAAAALLGASINYPMRGAVTWKSIVGTNVAADALSNLSSAGVIGGALIVVGEDYGAGASVIQERTHSFALKSSLILIDPQPTLQNLARPSLGHWWELLRRLTPILAEGGDPAFGAVRDLILGRKRGDLRHAADLDALLIEDIEGRSAARSTVCVRELFDHLVPKLLQRLDRSCDQVQRLRSLQFPKHALPKPL